MQTDVSVLQDMAEIQRVMDAVNVVPMPSKFRLGTISALLVLLDLPFQVVRPRPQAQTLVFVEEMLR